MPRHEDDQSSIKEMSLEYCRVAIRLQERDIELLRKMLDDTIDYGFRRNQENVLLLRSHKRLEDQLEEVMRNDKNR
jgi:hypothetical protein